MSLPHRLGTLASLLALSTALACAPGESPEAGGAPAEAAATAPAPTLSTATALGVANAREPIPGVIAAGQPTEEQFQALAEAGYVHFVSLRPATERGAGWEEAYAAEHGVDFTRLPIAGAPDLTRDNVETLDRILAATGGEPTVLYCGSSNRVGALLALRAQWLGGVPPQEALELGREAGMTRLEPAVAQLLGLTGGA